MEKELNKLQEEQLENVSGGLRAAGGGAKAVDSKNVYSKNMTAKAVEGRAANSKARKKMIIGGAPSPSKNKLIPKADEIIGD